MFLALRPCQSRILSLPTSRHPRPFVFGWPLTSSEKFDIVFRSIHQVILRWTNKLVCMWRVAAFPKVPRILARPIRCWLGGSRQSSGEMTWQARSHEGEPARPHDSRQSCYSCHDLFAAFSCGGFPLLDSWRMESPAAGATGSAAPVAVCDLRVRIRGSNRCAASAVPTLRKFERTIQDGADLIWECG